MGCLSTKNKRLSPHPAAKALPHPAAKAPPHPAEKALPPSAEKALPPSAAKALPPLSGPTKPEIGMEFTKKHPPPPHPNHTPTKTAPKKLTLLEWCGEKITVWSEPSAKATDSGALPDIVYTHNTTPDTVCKKIPCTATNFKICRTPNTDPTKSVLYITHTPQPGCNFSRAISDPETFINTTFGMYIINWIMWNGPASTDKYKLCKYVYENNGTKLPADNDNAMRKILMNTIKTFANPTTTNPDSTYSLEYADTYGLIFKKDEQYILFARDRQDAKQCSRTYAGYKLHMSVRDGTSNYTDWAETPPTTIHLNMFDAATRIEKNTNTLTYPDTNGIKYTVTNIDANKTCLTPTDSVGKAYKFTYSSASNADQSGLLIFQKYNLPGSSDWTIIPSNNEEALAIYNRVRGISINCSEPNNNHLLAYRIVHTIGKNIGVASDDNQIQYVFAYNKGAAAAVKTYMDTVVPLLAPVQVRAPTLAPAPKATLVSAQPSTYARSVPAPTPTVYVYSISADGKVSTALTDADPIYNWAKNIYNTPFYNNQYTSIDMSEHNTPALGQVCPNLKIAGLVGIKYSRKCNEYTANTPDVPGSKKKIKLIRLEGIPENASGYYAVLADFPDNKSILIYDQMECYTRDVTMVANPKPKYIIANNDGEATKLLDYINKLKEIAPDLFNGSSADVTTPAPAPTQLQTPPQLRTRQPI